MMLDRDPVYGEVDLRASAEELSRLADAVAQGAGLLAATGAPNGDALAGWRSGRPQAPECSSSTTPSGICS
ncbi:hypothetical protein ACFQ0M_41190 [Kitasatospora aburaviensis]